MTVFRDMKIGGKLILSFLIVVAIFTAISVYMIMNYTSLSALQDEGAGRADDAVEINHILEEFLELYPIIADSVINREFDVAESDFAEAKEKVEASFARVNELVDTEAERALAADYAEAAGEYIHSYEEEMFPVLSGSDTVAQRADDSMNIMEIEITLGGIYAIIADAVINRDLAGTQRDLAAIKAKGEEHLAHLDDMVDTAEERQDAADFKQAYQDYVSFFDNTMLPEISAGASMARISVLDGQVDGLRDRANSSLHKINMSLMEETAEAVSAEQAVRDYNGQIDGIRENVVEALKQIGASLEAEQDEADAKFDATIQQTIIIAIIVAIVGIIIAVILALVIAKGIRVPLTRCVALAKDLAGGDLMVSYTENRKDEIGMLVNSLNDMVESLKEVVVGVQTGAEYVASGSEEMSSTAQNISQGSTEQAAAGEQVSSSMEEMSSNIQQNADNAAQTEKISQQAAHDAKESGEAVLEAVDAMKSIAEKIAIIEEIARSTNMLSLNASIEAARAGEHGKGFAVVAAEVGKLAARSKEAAGEITELSARTVEVAAKAGEMLNKLVPDILKTADLVQEISAASAEQRNGAEQINKAVLQLDQVIQQNASASEELASTAEELSSQSEQLQSGISYFQVDTNGSGKKQKQKQLITANAGEKTGITLHQTSNIGGKAIKPAAKQSAAKPEVDDSDFEEF